MESDGKSFYVSYGRRQHLYSANSGKFDPYYEALYVYDGINEYTNMLAASLPGFPESGSSGSVVQAGQGFFVIALYDRIVFNFNSTMQVHNTGCHPVEIGRS